MAVKGYGTLLQYKIASGSYTTLARVKSIKPATMSREEIDVTTLDSPDEFEEVMAGMGSGGELQAVIEYDKTRTGTLAGTTIFGKADVAWRLKYPDGSGWDYPAGSFLKDIGDEEVVAKDVVRTNVTIRVSGKPTHSSALA